jgi:hypothetical protein
MTITIKIDWNKDGDYSDTGENVTTRVMERSSVTLEYGRDQSTALAPMVAGRGGFTLNNASQDYNPLNASSPIFGLIKPARPVQIIRTVSATPYTLFEGHTDDTPLNPSLSEKTVTVSMVDYLADFRGYTLNTALYSGMTTGDAIDQILDEVGWAGSRDLDTGSTTLPYWWEDGTDAFTALNKLLECEGPPAYLAVDAGPTIVFRDRQHRLLDAASTSSQATWTGSTTNSEMYELTYDDAWRNIINTGSISIDVRLPQALEEVWTQDNIITLGAAEVKTFIASGSDPFTSAEVPVSGTDYTLVSGSVTPTLSRTSGASTVITLTAGGGGAVLNRLALRAKPVSTVYSVQVTASDATSITAYGPRSFPSDPSFASVYDAQAVLDKAIEQHKDPLPIVEGTFSVGQNLTRAASVLARNLSDRVTLTVSGMSLNTDFFVESFRHDFANPDLRHDVTVGMEKVPAAGSVSASDVFILGSSTVNHRLGTGKLAL